MTTPDFDRLARLVDDAAREVRAIPQLSAEDTFTLADAYEIQRRSIARRVERGARRVGVKMGFTSLAKQAQMGVSTVIWGRLTDGMGLQEHEPLDLSRFIHPRIEPEVAFLLGRDLVGEVTLPEAFAAVDG
ncbi:MAG: 4-oxalocrotonate decarboxylase, partial [Myxococcota bacterium]